MRRPRMALAKVFLGIGIGIGTALAVATVSAQQPPALLGNGSGPGPVSSGPSAPALVPAASGSPAGELLLPTFNPSRGARHLLRNGWDYVTYQEYDRALSFFREAEARQKELNESERTKLKQGIERAQRGIREASSGMKTEQSYARSGRPSVPGAIAVAGPQRPDREPIQLAGGEVPTENSANVRASGDAIEPVVFQPTAPAPAELPMTPEVDDVVLPTVPEAGVGAVSLPPFSSVGEEPAPAPVRGPEPAPVPVPVDLPAPAPEPQPEPVAPASGEVLLPDAPAPTPEPSASPDPGLELPPIPVVEQLPPLPSGMDEDMPAPVISPIPESPPVAHLPGNPEAAVPPTRLETDPGFDPPPADPAPEAPSATRGDETPFDLPRRSASPVSTLSPELRREVEEIARRQENEFRQNPPQTVTDMTADPSEYGPGGSTRLEISRAPSPTEARPIRAIQVPEEFVPLPKRDWQPNRKYWAAAATCHMPLYFQDAVLERYGYSMEQRFGPAGRFLSYPIDDPKQSKQRNQLIQPWFSAGLFAAQIALLPYNLIVDPPWEAEYDLGYYRPGDRVPTDVYYLPKTGVGPIGGYYGKGHHQGPGPTTAPTPRW